MWIFHTTNTYTVCLYNSYQILVKFVHVTTLHLGVPFMGRQQREGPLTFHMALAYFVISAALYVITLAAGELVVRYLLHTSSCGISLHNNIV